MKINIFIMGFLMCGCSRTPQEAVPMSWRIDSQPIVSRFPLVKGASTLIWYGEIAGHSSFLSVPAPSAYRVRCFAEGFSNAFPNAGTLSDLQPVVLPPEVKFPKHLHSASSSAWFTSSTINKSLFPWKYSGKAFYAPKDDLLYFDVFWE